MDWHAHSCAKEEHMPSTKAVAVTAAIAFAVIVLDQFLGLSNKVAGMVGKK